MKSSHSIFVLKELWKCVDYIRISYIHPINTLAGWQFYTFQAEAVNLEIFVPHLSWFELGHWKPIAKIKIITHSYRFIGYNGEMSVVTLGLAPQFHLANNC